MRLLAPAFCIACLCGLSPKLAAQGLDLTHPSDLDMRLGMAMARLTTLEQVPAFTLDFVLSDVRLDRSDPRRFYNFSGDLSGRYLEVMSVAVAEGALPGGQLPNGFSVDALADSIIAYQQADGRFGDPALAFTAEAIGGEHMALLWGNGRMLVGLMAYYESTQDAAALAAARRLGDFFITTATAARQPAVVKRLEGFGAKGIICFTQYIEGLVMLARATGDARYRQAAVDAYEVMPPRGVQHSHGYLSTLRGVVDLYRLTEEPKHLAYVRGLFDDLLASDDYTLFGAVKEYFGGEQPGRDHHGERDEGCSSADFVRLALQLYQVTGEARYREAAHYAIPNALAFNQYASGDFGHHFLEEGHLAPSNPRRSWWCCTMHGLRALLAVEHEFALRLDDRGRPELSLLLPMSFSGAGFAGRLNENVDETGRFIYTLSFKQVVETPLEIQLPNAAQYGDWQVLSAGLELAGDARSITLAAPRIGQMYVFSARPTLRLVSGPTTAVPPPTAGQPSGGALTLGHYLLGTRTDAYVAEPDHANQIDFPTLEPLAGRVGVGGKFREGGFPGVYEVELVPVATQTMSGHGYMRVRTDYAVAPGFRSPDR